MTHKILLLSITLLTIITTSIAQDTKPHYRLHNSMSFSLIIRQYVNPNEAFPEKSHSHFKYNAKDKTLSFGSISEYKSYNGEYKTMVFYEDLSNFRFTKTIKNKTTGIKTDVYEGECGKKNYTITISSDNGGLYIQTHWGTNEFEYNMTYTNDLHKYVTMLNKNN